ncbi:hypothetical protein Taro_012181 [Colocasia esculenta]|uniref:GST N-terminal domain-containing protein n=1 Tax=Colocasia esculenta TaxID=4460 RepID=A0A843U3B2_COLES|nr:hypothetical protein [Colocasia esculenta]
MASGSRARATPLAALDSAPNSSRRFGRELQEAHAVLVLAEQLLAARPDRPQPQGSSSSLVSSIPTEPLSSVFHLTYVHTQCRSEFEKLNPIHFVPVLVDEGIVVADSFAIILYLEEKYPQHPLLPHDLQKKAINYQTTSMLHEYSGRIISGNTLMVIHLNGRNATLEEVLQPSGQGHWQTSHPPRFEPGALPRPIRIGTSWETEVTVSPSTSTMNIHTGWVVNHGFQLHGLRQAKGVPPSEMFGLSTAPRVLTPYPILARLMDAYDEIPAFRSARPEMQPDCPSTS